MMADRGKGGEVVKEVKQVLCLQMEAVKRPKSV
jgi:hypothetical protein